MSPDQIDTLKTLWCIGEKVSFIAETLGVSPRWVTRMKHRLGLPARGR